MTGLEIYMAGIEDNLTRLERLYEHNFSKEIGGHVAWVTATKKTQLQMITIARNARALMSIHQDTPEGYRLRSQIHQALREIENA